MTITYGLTSTGFVPKTVEVVRAEIAADVQAKFGASVDVSDGSFLGQLIGILAEREGALWDLAQAVYATMDPDAASEAALDALAALTGTFRPIARTSSVTETLTGTPTTVVGSGSQIKTASTGIVFVTLASATITALTAWAPSTTYVIGDRRTNASRCYQCIVGGVSAGSGGPTTTAADITDGGVHWRYLGDGTGAVDVAAQSKDTGPIVAVSGDLKVINTPVGGWSSCVNVLDATLGQDLGTDEQLRVLREEELAAAGTGTPNAIRAALLEIVGVTSATVFVNNTDSVNSDGMPPHSVEALVQGGVDQDILSVLFANVAAGIAFQGTTTGTVVDSQGVSQTVKFSRPANVNVYVDITVVKDPTTYPSDGDSQIKLAIVAYGQKQATGKDAVAVSVGAQAFTVAGVLDVPRSGSLGGTLIGTAPSPTLDATIAITSRQLAVFDTSRITVHSSNGTP